MLWWTLRQLKAKSARTRSNAARKLGQARDARAVAPLLVALRDQSRDVQHTAAEALVRLGPAAVVALVAALQDESPASRQVVQTLGHIPGAVQALVAALWHEHPASRQAVAALLTNGVSL